MLRASLVLLRCTVAALAQVLFAGTLGQLSVRTGRLSRDRVPLVADARALLPGGQEGRAITLAQVLWRGRCIASLILLAARRLLWARPLAFATVLREDDEHILRDEYMHAGVGEIRLGGRQGEPFAYSSTHRVAWQLSPAHQEESAYVPRC